MWSSIYLRVATYPQRYGLLSISFPIIEDCNNLTSNIAGRERSHIAHESYCNLLVDGQYYCLSSELPAQTSFPFPLDERTPSRLDATLPAMAGGSLIGDGSGIL